MRFNFCLLLFCFFITSLQLNSAETGKITPSSFTPFTGKVTRNKVRMRLQPNLDGQIIKELVKNDLLIIKGEEEEFYIVSAPKDISAYVYRTYVLDNIVEGNRVNVRLEPDTDAPVIAQLSAGDKVEGDISPLNSKWLEIAPPDTAQFFVCKEYVEKIGDANFMTIMEKRKKDVETLLESATLLSQAELQKPYEQIDLNTVFSQLDKIIQTYKDFPDQAKKATYLLKSMQDTYLQKKVVYLEAKTTRLPSTHESAHPLTTLELGHQPPQEPSHYADVKIEKMPTSSTYTTNSGKKSTVDWTQGFKMDDAPEKMAQWIPIEKALYFTWAKTEKNPSVERFYHQQINNATVIKGVIEPYNRTNSQRPGDYVLINKQTNLPTAYLYSTQINLQNYLGKEITMTVTSRPNNQFAFPAYFVLAID